MKNWFKALFSEMLPSAWWILSALSTLSTFFLKGWSGKPRLVSVISTILGFTWANFRVFQKQQAEIVRLCAAKQSADAAISLQGPLIGLESRPIASLSTRSLWTTPVALRNYGKLPATHLNATFEFRTESSREGVYPAQFINGPESAEISPGSAYEKDLLPALNTIQQRAIASQSTKLILATKVAYRAPDGRQFDYTAEATLDIASSRFVLIKSETRAI